MSYCCNLDKGESGKGCVSGDYLFIYVCRNSDLFALSCACNIRVFRGNVASVLYMCLR